VCDRSHEIRLESGSVNGARIYDRSQNVDWSQDIQPELYLPTGVTSSNPSQAYD
jgi:hypothetical protein